MAKAKPKSKPKKAEKQKPVYWITGNYYDTCQRWKDICALIEDPNVEIFDCGHNPDNVADALKVAQAADIIMALKHKDLFDHRVRIIKMKGLPPDYNLISNYLHLVNKDTILVIDSPIGYVKPGSKRFISAATSKFYKLIKSNGVLRESPKEARSINQAATWVGKVLDDHNRTYDKEAVRLMVELCGRDLDGLYSEIIKILAYEPKKITVDTVRKCIVPQFLRQAWDLVEDLWRRDVNVCLEHMERFYQTAGREVGESFQGNIEMLMAVLDKYFDLLRLAKDACGEYPSYDKIRGVAEGFKKKPKAKEENSKDGKLVEWDQDKYNPGFIYRTVNLSSFQSAMRWSKPEVYSAHCQVLETRIALRTAQYNEYNKGRVKLMIDAMVLHICKDMTYSDCRKIRGD